MIRMGKSIRHIWVKLSLCPNANTHVVYVETCSNMKVCNVRLYKREFNHVIETHFIAFTYTGTSKRVKPKESTMAPSNSYFHFTPQFSIPFSKGYFNRGLIKLILKSGGLQCSYIVDHF